MITLYKRGRVWWMRGSVNGEPVRESLRTTFRDIAEKKAHQLELAAVCPQKSWKEFAPEFEAWIAPHISQSTRNRYAWIVRRFSRFLDSRGVLWLRSVTPDLVAAYGLERRNDLHPTRHITVRGGVRLDFRVLRRIFSYALQCRYIAENPVRQPGLNRTETQTLPFTADDIRRMLADRGGRPPEEIRALVLFFLATGLRISDVILCPRSAVHLASGDVFIVTKKTRRRLLLPLHPELPQALRDHLAVMNPAQRDSPLLFPSRTGKLQVSLDAKLRRLWDRAGVLNGHAHRFRDTFAVSLLEQGASLYDVSKLLGNSVAVCERHYSPYVRELQERNRRLVHSIDILRDR